MITTLFLSVALFAQDAAPSPEEASPPAEAAIEAPAFDTEAAIAGVNGWLNGIETYQARFDQIAPDGSASGGTLYIRRPGRLRFDYDAPSPLLVVADGTTVAIEDSALNTVDRVPLRSTPLWWLLKPDADLSEDARVTDVWTEDGRLYVGLADANDEMDGQALFVFHPESYALEEWFVSDSLGYTTRVILSEVETGMSLNPRLFILDEPEEDRRTRRQ
ncbi:LolA family protein [Hyphobacterium sp.]|uniref:LolA family protein n=1 Tax=Hyphobacterium sp. TaxID=2004662 RepID=UPI003BA8A3C3